MVSSETVDVSAENVLLVVGMQLGTELQFFGIGESGTHGNKLCVKLKRV